MSMIEQATEQLKALNSICSDMEALADAAGAKSFGLPIEKQAALILLMEEAVDRIDKMRPILNRNLVPTRLSMAKGLISKEIEEVKMLGHSFKVVSKCVFSAPPKTKKPEEYAALILWLSENHPGRAIEEKTTVNIGGKDLSDLCTDLLEDGQPLPPNVSEFNQITIKTKELKNG